MRGTPWVVNVSKRMPLREGRVVKGHAGSIRATFAGKEGSKPLFTGSDPITVRLLTAETPQSSVTYRETN